MRIVFFGTPEFAVPCFDRLLHSPDHEILGVVTQPDRRRGRGSRLMFSPVKSQAVAQELPLWQPERLKRDQVTLDHLKNLGADVFVVVAYGQLLSKALLDMPRLGCVNVHGSLLPAYRGAAPIQWSLYDGVTETGITTMRMDEGMDTGDMLLKARVPVSPLDHAQVLADRLAQVGADLLMETLQAWEQGEITPEPQDHHQATYASLVTKEHYSLDWERSSWQLHNQIRGFYPQCQTLFRGDSLKIMGTIPLGCEIPGEMPPDWDPLMQRWHTEEVDPAAKPGQVIALWKNQGAVVKTGVGALLLTQVQPPGKRPLSGWDFVNGARLKIPEQLG